MSESKDEQVRAWIERGKQVGRSLSVERDGRAFYLRVAVQKRDAEYTVLVDEIEEARMAEEEYVRDEQRAFESLEAARRFIEETTPVRLDELQPSKGQKWF
jgi:uncharacterized protein involved in exopolysaccharide biosynthesis